MSKIGVAVLGASMRSTMILAYLNRHPSEGFVAGIYDRFPARCECLLDKYGLADVAIYESLEQAVSDGCVGATFVSTPDVEHAEPVVASLRAGKHVYCEKPLAITLEGCDAMIGAAKDAGSIFYLGMNLRHGPVHETLHEIVAGGQLGKLLTIEANEYYYGGRTYFRRWNRLRKFGGGLWITKACHDFDLLNWMAGGHPNRVFAVCSLSHYKPNPKAGTHCRECSISSTCPDYYDVEAPENRLNDMLMKLSEQATGQPRDLCLYNSDKDTFDNGVAIVEYDSDVRATYTVNVVSSRTTRQMRLVGTEGSAEGDMEDGIITVRRRHSEEKIVHDLSKRMKSSHGGSDDKIMADFFRCCRTGDKPRSSWADGRLGVEVGLAARQSCDTGEPVEIQSAATSHLPQS